MPSPSLMTIGVSAAVLGASGVKGRKVTVLSNSSTEPIMDLIRSIVDASPDLNDPFYVLDLGAVVQLFQKWTRCLKDVQPFYAVKCNPEPALLGALAALGAGFDCASRVEVEAVLAVGVATDRIIYANPCKADSHIKYAAAAGVNLATFDSIHELEKIRRHHSKCSLLLRLKPPDETGSRCPLGTKYGALPEEVAPLLQAARSAGLPVIGVAFHVGSGGTNSGTYQAAIAFARTVFTTADRLGGPRMLVLDIGGGFTAGPRFVEAVEVIKSSLEAYFGDRPDLRVIAEPGRMFAETVFTLATSIIGKRVRGELREYWINDGIYGSMSCIKNDLAKVTVAPLAPVGEETTYTSTVFGPTCDSYDTVLTGEQLPDLGVGDWLVSPNMGAYSASTGSSFNGFVTSSIRIHLAYSDPEMFHPTIQMLSDASGPFIEE